MRKVTKQAVNEFYLKGKMKQGNTEVFYSKSQDTSYMSLHGNTIAIYSHFNDSLKISSCGWLTDTTKERLNGLKNVCIQQKAGKWYLNGEKWDGDLIDIKN